ncbi:MAG: SRPBCC family protein [Saccharopolyspora sp.]|uniref:SRPBCC family protein n=1 Tax=Saccharopolyspora sp. TaxID=33915 RepID=UPI0025D5F794|nr:SRPBCC family protein [Saccharopolyspora sp.]MBQ6643974.1 SRPBCC family protein [Saccharopolyspora sp.]
METTAEASGPATPDEVWERYADPSRWPGWAPQITEVHTDAVRIAPGADGRLFAAGGVRLDFTVTDVDEQHRKWSWSVRFGLLTLHLDHGVEAAGEGSTTWLNARGPAFLIMPYMPFARSALQNLVQQC